MSAIKLALQQSQKKVRRKTSEDTSAEVSPDSRCPICLDKFNNISYLEFCRHKFCFRCIHEWSRFKAECPLCKHSFNSIYHTINSEQDFKKYDLPPVEDTSYGLGFLHYTVEYPTMDIAPPRSETERRAERERRRAEESLREQETVNFRRKMYRQGVRIQRGNDVGPPQDITAEFFRTHPVYLHRLIPWLKRELIVLYEADGSLVNIVQHFIMSCITHYNMEDGAIQEELRPFLLGRTEHFLHEFISFAKCHLIMEAYDEETVYDYPAASSPHNQTDSVKPMASQSSDPSGAGQSENAETDRTEHFLHEFISFAKSDLDMEIDGDSRSPSTKLRPHNSKPGGKRKYKTRHLEETFKNALSEKNEQERQRGARQ